ncbi:hypothetical protein FQZ97_836760 [compost metagenome]
MQVAAQQDAAGDGVERQQQDDERQVLGQQHMHAQFEAGVPTELPGKRQQEQQRPAQGELAVVLMPDTDRQQRQQGDAQQDAREGQYPEQAKARAVHLGGEGSPRQAAEQGGR